MNGHLSPQRISLWMLGERTAEDERHVRECAQCAAELARMGSTLAGFRGSVRQWSESQDSAAPKRTWTSERTVSWSHRLRWAAVAAVLLLVGLVPIYRTARHSPAGVAIAQSDAELLEEVDAEVSRAVPQPMEPLLNLVAWDSANGTETTGKENNEAKQQK